MSIVEVTRPIVGGVDTHLDVHVAAAVDPVGGLLGVESFPTTPAGYHDLSSWLSSFGPVERVGVEGTGTYGAGLARHLSASGIVVVEVDRPNRQARRRNGKSDELDAIEAARAALSGRASGAAKSATGNVEALRTLLVAKRSARSIRIKTIGQLRHLVITAPDDLRDRLGGLTTKALIRQAQRYVPGQAAIPWGTRSRPPSSPSPAGSRPSTPRSPRSTPTSTPWCVPPHPPCSRSTASARTPPPSSSPPPATTPAGSAPRQPGPRSVASPRFLPARARPTAATASTKAATARRTTPCGGGGWPPPAQANPPRSPTCNVVSPRAAPSPRSSGRSSATSHAKSSSRSLPEHREPPPGHGDGTGPRLP